jgi:hypothetical protein
MVSIESFSSRLFIVSDVGLPRRVVPSTLASSASILLKACHPGIPSG